MDGIKQVQGFIQIAYWYIARGHKNLLIFCINFIVPTYSKDETYSK